MRDINHMGIDDFNNLYEYIARREKTRKHEPVPLRESNKRMIQKTKEKNKKKNKKQDR